MDKLDRKLTHKAISSLLYSSLVGLLLTGFSPIVFYSAARAQDNTNQSENSDRQLQNRSTFYVNPTTGNDERGQGTSQSPFKTITQALMLAKPNTTIVLAEGTYSQETGEEFPLMLKQNVIIQGNAESLGKDIIIQGGGTYISPTAAAQNVTMVATKNAGKIIGVTIMNPSSRGHGLWIESASPEVSSNMFAGNGTSGVSVNGNSKPIIVNNYFYQNRGNGLLVYGTSQPQIKNNIFDRTGFGISAVQNTVITVLNNRFSGNRIGIILEGNAQAILRNNSIENSSDAGVVAIAKSKVDLGTTNQSGNNSFKNNTGSDIRNLTKNETIAAYGNQLNSKNQGSIDLNATTSPIDVALVNSTANNSPNNNDSDRKTPTLTNNNDRNSRNNTLTGNKKPNNTSTNTSTNTNRNNTTTSTNNNTATNTDDGGGREIVFTAPTDTEINNDSSETLPDTPISESNNNDSSAGTLPPPPSISGNNSTENNNSNNNSNVNNNSSSHTNNNPNSSKLGNIVGNLSGNSSNNNNTVADNSDYDSTIEDNSDISSNNISSSNSSGYRVIIATRNDSQKEEVKSIYPDAFSTNYNGRSMLQIGVFSSRENAEKTLQDLKDKGFEGLVLTR